MKMTWLHMEFVLIFITGPSQGKLGRTAAERLLALALLPPQLKTKHLFLFYDWFFVVVVAVQRYIFHKPRLGIERG